MRNPLSWIVVGIVKIYQIFISPLKPPLCRFRPTCSEYLVQAIRIKGLVRGSWMAIRRLARCHPFCEGGFDPVIPDATTELARPRGDRDE